MFDFLEKMKLKNPEFTFANFKAVVISVFHGTGKLGLERRMVDCQGQREVQLLAIIR
jgi:hypothetical protein